LYKVAIKGILFRFTVGWKIKVKEKDASAKPNKHIPIEIEIKAYQKGNNYNSTSLEL
jgi:hypothetical protein